MHSDSSSGGPESRDVHCGMKCEASQRRVTSQSETESDQWMGGGRNALIRTGNINVQREWEVRHGDRGSQGMQTSYPSGLARFDAAKVKADNIV